MGEIAQKLLPIFLKETVQRIEVIARFIEGPDDGTGLDALKAAYRAAHTVKGTAGLVKLPVTREIAGQIEDVFAALLKKRRTASPKIKDALQQALELLQQQVAAVANGSPETPVAAEQAKHLFEPFRRRSTQPASTPPAEEAAQPVAPAAAEEAFSSAKNEASDPQDESAVAEQDKRSVVNVCCQFRVSGRTFSLPMADMVEIGSFSSVLGLPLAPPYVRGLLNLRSQVMPVIDLDPVYGQPIRTLANRHLVIAEAAGDRLAFLTDGIPSLAPEFAGETIRLKEFIHRYGIKAN